MIESHPYSIFKVHLQDEVMILNPDRILGICKVKWLKFETLLERYGSMKYTKDYDSLPLVLRLWLTYHNWKRVKELAETVQCTDKIFYPDIVEIYNYQTEEYGMLALPLIIMDKENAVLLAPREIRPEHFKVKHETEIAFLEEPSV